MHFSSWLAFVFNFVSCRKQKKGRVACAYLCSDLAERWDWGMRSRRAADSILSTSQVRALSLLWVGCTQALYQWFNLNHLSVLSLVTCAPADCVSPAFKSLRFCWEHVHRYWGSCINCAQCFHWARVILLPPPLTASLNFEYWQICLPILWKTLFSWFSCISKFGKPRGLWQNASLDSRPTSLC